MSESGKLISSGEQASRSANERIVSASGRSVSTTSKKQADAKIDKFTAPKRGARKDYDLPNGYKVTVIHRGVNRGTNEFYATVSKDGEARNGVYYAQYLTNGAYPGPYSMVSSSKQGAFDNVKTWIKGLIK